MSWFAGIKFKKGKNLKKDYAGSDDGVAQLVVVGRSIHRYSKEEIGGILLLVYPCCPTAPTHQFLKV